MTEETVQETMVYRKPTSDSAEDAVQEIWGKKLETRVVDASEVPELLAAGWVTHPMDIGKKPEERAGFVRDLPGQEKLLREALESEQNAVKDLTAKNEKLLADLDGVQAKLTAAETELAETKKLLEEATKPAEKKETLGVKGG